MSEVDLPALAKTGNTREESKAPNPMSEIDDALRACTFGRFHVKLLFVAFLAFVAQVLVSSSTSYLLPSAECDLHMNLIQKGLLNAMPYFGMLLSSVIAGFLTDTFGRRIFLLVGFGGIFIFTLIAGSSQSYEVLVTAKFLEGVLSNYGVLCSFVSMELHSEWVVESYHFMTCFDDSFATSFGAVVSLTSEFCYNAIRDRVMLCQSSFVALSHIIIAAMSWIILIQDWNFTLFGGKFVLNTWNIYLYILSLWSLAAWIMYATLLPESPKYLVTQEKYDEAREILISVYRQNTGKPADTYPYINIWKDKSKYAIDESKEVNTSIRHQLVVGLHNIKPMFRKPLVASLALICFMNIIIMATYNVLRLWFPQLSTIVEHNSLQNKDLCELLDKYTHELKIASLNATHSDVCVPTKSGNETYINSIIIGCVCLLPYFITGVLVNKVGKKPLFITAGLISVGTTLGLRWASTKLAIVALFSAAIAITQIMLSLNQTVTVEVFPTTTRTLAICLMMVSGRIGTLIGNIIFPILLNMGCVVPFYTISGLMAGVTILLFFLQTEKN